MDYKYEWKPISLFHAIVPRYIYHSLSLWNSLLEIRQSIFKFTLNRSFYPLKSSKPKKQSLALVVSTPTMAKGQKRKATNDLSKEKGKNKKRESSSALVLEWNTLYLDKDMSQERYNLDFSFRKVLNGRWINYSFFNSHNFRV